MGRQAVKIVLAYVISILLLGAACYLGYRMLSPVVELSRLGGSSEITPTLCGLVVMWSIAAGLGSGAFFGLLARPRPTFHSLVLGCGFLTLSVASDSLLIWQRWDLTLSLLCVMPFSVASLAAIALFRMRTSTC